MLTTRLKGRITGDGQLIVETPVKLMPGAVEVILRRSRRASRGRSLTSTEHPAFGLWADRDNIDDSAAFARQLRQRLEDRSDGDHRE